MRSTHAQHASHYRRNLRALYRRASEADKRDGIAWYRTAESGCRMWANHFGLDVRTVACVIAAISPQCDWQENIRLAFDMLSDRPVYGKALRVNLFKARRILVDRAIAMNPYFKAGPKVCAFAANLSGNGDAVTIDTHGIQAAMNHPTTTKSIHPSSYRVFAECYATVAREFGLRPCDFQATIWCVWKRRYSPARKRQIIREDKAA